MRAPALPITTNSVANSDPPVHVWFNSSGDYVYGDRAKVYAKSAESGYLVVLRADVDGQVRVLFPVDPQDDQHVVGGKKYELKGRGDREAFVADDTVGSGTVLAAHSATPFRFDEFMKDGHWDTAALSGSPQDVRADPEGQLRTIVDRMRPEGAHFDYDVANYVVKAPPRYVRAYYPDPYYGWPGWWGYGFGPAWWGVGPRFGTAVIVEPRFRPVIHR
jgi:hypothetical protein